MKPSVQPARWRPIYTMTAVVIIWIVMAVTLTSALVHFSRVEGQRTRPATPKLVGDGMSDDLSDITIRPSCTWSDYPLSPGASFIVTDFRLLKPQTITGLSAGDYDDGRVVVVRSSGVPIILRNEDMRSLARNRIRSWNRLNVLVDAEHSVALLYDAGDQRWRVFPMTPGKSPPGGTGDVLDCPVRPTSTD